MILVAAVPLMPVGVACAGELALADLNSVLGELRDGGFVIYFRHATTDSSMPKDVAEDLSRCETQRNLSPKGRTEAIQTGQAIKALGVPIGSVITSPFCRTKDTAQLIFGRFAENPGLRFVISTDAAETKRLAAALREMLATAPAKGTNTVLVSHSANLFEAAGIFAKPECAAYVFRPLADGRFEAVARILPEDWSKAAKLKHLQ